jgi:AAA+ superfamily predicted ATPase
MEARDTLVGLFLSRQPAISLEHSDETRALDVISSAWKTAMDRRLGALASDEATRVPSCKGKRVCLVAEWSVASTVRVYQVTHACSPTEEAPYASIQSGLAGVLSKAYSAEDAIAKFYALIDSSLATNPDVVMCLCLTDTHNLSGEDQIIFRRRVKEFYRDMTTKDKARNIMKFSSLVLLTLRQPVDVPEYDEVVKSVVLKPPTREELAEVFSGMYDKMQLTTPPDFGSKELYVHRVASALSGLEKSAAVDAIKLCKATTGVVRPEDALAAKTALINKSTVITLTNTEGMNISDVGGAEVLKAWLRSRLNAFDPAAAEFGLAAPKGLLLLGPPGTGKSFLAKTIGAMLGMPVIALDMGKIFGAYVGQSEGNLRGALTTAEAVAPCVLHIDEIEKALGSGDQDGGTSKRVLGTILTWMQDKTAPVFVVATANSVRGLPPELLRRGRFDEIFFVDLPNVAERREILNVHMRRRRLTASKATIDCVVSDTTTYTGAEIEALVKDVLYELWDNRAARGTGREVELADFQKVMAESKTLYSMLGASINQDREWAKTRVRFANANVSFDEQPPKPEGPSYDDI